MEPKNVPGMFLLLLVGNVHGLSTGAASASFRLRALRPSVRPSMVLSLPSQTSTPGGSLDEECGSPVPSQATPCPCRAPRANRSRVEGIIQRCFGGLGWSVGARLPACLLLAPQRCR
eukprot:scaffold14805_cov121-Isochrysis_galbana.AAC.11